MHLNLFFISSTKIIKQTTKDFNILILIPSPKKIVVFCYQKIVRKNCSSDREKLLKVEAEGREFAKILRSLEQFIQTVKGQNNFW